MPKASSLRGTEKVLVVDDEEHVRDTIKKVLTKSGYQVLLAASAEEALKACESQVPDAVLTDIVMPGQGGLGLAERLSEQLPALKILLMTGYAPTRVDVRWPHLTKPFAPTELLSTLRSVLDEA